MDPPPLLHDRAFCMIVAPKSTLRNESGGVGECLHFLSYLYPDRGARIVYNDTIDGWTDDLEDIDLMAGSAIELTANVENKIPAYLTVSATAIDVQGKPIPENLIKVEVSSVINASEDGKTPVVTPLKIRLTEGEPGSVALVDGLTFRIEAASGEEGAKSIVGQTINAYNHTLKARDIKVRLVGKIIVNKD